MPRTHLPYPPEFRRQMVELVRSGRAIRELAREFECSDQTIRKWVRQADLWGTDIHVKPPTWPPILHLDPAHARLRREVRAA